MASLGLFESAQTESNMLEKVDFKEGEEREKREKSSEGEEKGELERMRDLISL